MALAPNFDDLSYGDETRRYGDYVGLPHDEATDGIKEGQAVTLDGTDAALASADTDPLVGVAYTYSYTGDSGGPSDPGVIDQDAPLTVKTSGTVKAEVESGVLAGDALVAGLTNPGIFDNPTTDSQDNRAIALTDAKEQDDAQGNTRNYADVLLL